MLIEFADFLVAVGTMAGRRAAARAVAPGTSDPQDGYG